jgi:hypothetical protein
MCAAAVVIFGYGVAGNAQTNGIQFGKQTIESVSFDVALSRALKSSSLTFAAKPFHAVMEIGSPGDTYSGHIEAWWESEKKYRIDINSPAFHQIEVVSEGHAQVETQGNYYPRWLENFVQALMDPVAMAANFSGRNATSMSRDSQLFFTSVSRDDRTNGITDPMTVGRVEFVGPDYLLRMTSMFNNSMLFSDWKDFGHKKIAQTYETTFLDGQRLAGRLVLLEELRYPAPSIFRIDGTAPASQGISTAFISTSQAEKLLESAPAMDWPLVREGRTDGYMIVFARTDRSGQVRETAEYSSHNPNPALQKYGMEQARKYKFKPLVIDGVAVQLETPLVMHFISRIENPIPILSVDEMRRQMISCEPKDLPRGPLPSGNVMHCRIGVDERGKFAWFVSSDPIKDGAWGPALNSLKECTFKPYIVNGQPTYFKGDMELMAR